MNAHVHYGLTRQWALDEGFSAEEADMIASADVAVDELHPGGLFHPANWGYHYRLFGARRFARRGLQRAVRTGSLHELGVALHRVQDDVAHGWPGLLSHLLDPRVDVWEHRSARDRFVVERLSRLMLCRVASERRKRRRRR